MRYSVAMNRTNQTNQPPDPIGERLRYFMFDWDDNILQMPTCIHLDKWTGSAWEPISVSTSEFAAIRNDTETYRPPGGDWDQAFRDFHDDPDDAPAVFLSHTHQALDRILSGDTTPAPSFHKFKEALIEGRLFAIITARSHSARTIRTGVESFIDRVLSASEKSLMIENLRTFVAYFDRPSTPLRDEEVLRRYLDSNRYYAVSSPEFRRAMGLSSDGAENPAGAKQLAIREFVSHVVRLTEDRWHEGPISIGFSDDDPGNLSAVEDFLKTELAREFPGVKFVVYDTSDPERENGKKIIVEHGLETDPPDQHSGGF